MLVFVLLVVSIYAQNSNSYELPTWVKMGMSEQEIKRNIPANSIRAWRETSIGSVLIPISNSPMFLYEIQIDRAKGLTMFGISSEALNYNRIRLNLINAYGDPILSDNGIDIFFVGENNINMIKFWHEDEFLNIYYYFDNWS